MARNVPGPVRPQRMYYLYVIRTVLGDYIGVSKDVQRRFNAHSRRLSLIGNAIRHDPDSLIRVLAAGDRSYIYDLEAKAISTFETRWPTGLNLAAGGFGGRDPLPSTRAKWTAVRTGMSPGPETRARMAVAKKGKTLTAEHRAKIGTANIGKHAISSDHLAKLRKINTGRQQSVGTRARRAASLRGRVQSAETIAKRVATRARNKIVREGVTI